MLILKQKLFKRKKKKTSCVIMTKRNSVKKTGFNPLLSLHMYMYNRCQDNVIKQNQQKILIKFSCFFSFWYCHFFIFHVEKEEKEMNYN